MAISEFFSRQVVRVVHVMNGINADGVPLTAPNDGHLFLISQSYLRRSIKETSNIKETLQN